MSWVAVGVGVSAVGAGTSIFGSISAGNAADQARKDQQRALEQQGKIADQNLQFQQGNYLNQMSSLDRQQELAQKEYDDWESTYGSMQENVVNYYKSLDPTQYKAQAFANIDEEYQNMSERLDQNLASRGIQGGGVEAGARAALMSQTALARGNAGINAQRQYVGDQQQALANSASMSNPYGKGLQQSELNRAQLQGNFGNTMANAFSGQMGAAGNMANMYGNSAAGYDASAAGFGQAAGSFINSGISGLGKMGGAESFQDVGDEFGGGTSGYSGGKDIATRPVSSTYTSTVGSGTGGYGSSGNAKSIMDLGSKYGKQSATTTQSVADNYDNNSYGG